MVPHQLLPVTINNQELIALCDSGNSYGSLISRRLCEELGIKASSLAPTSVRTIATADPGSSLRVVGKVPHKLHLRLEGSDTKLSFRPTVVEEMSSGINLGGAFLKMHNITQNYGDNTLRVQGKKIHLLPNDGPWAERVGRPTIIEAPVRVAEDTLIPPRSEMVFELACAEIQNGNVLLEGRPRLGKAGHHLHDIEIPVSPLSKAVEGRIFTRVMNTGPHRIAVPAGTEWGKAVRVRPSGDRAALGPTVAEIPRKPRERQKLTPLQFRERCENVLKAFRLKENVVLKKRKDYQKACALIMKYYDLFSWDGDLGKTGLIEHDIELDSQAPVRHKLKPLNPYMAANLASQVKSWLKNGVVRESQSDFCNRLVPVRKKSGSTRWCVDFRDLNARSRKDSHPVGDVMANINYLGGSTIFSACDAVQAFHAIPLSERASRYTAFSTPSGHYEFTRMPFGLTNAPATYSRLVQLILKGIRPEVCLPYLDDCLIHSPDLESHFPALDTVLAAFSKSGLKLEPQKCHFFRANLTYLGHEVSPRGTEPMKAYVKVVEDWPVPRTRTNLRAFLGKALYYKRFIKDCASIAKPLFDKLAADGLKDNETFEVSQEYIEAFERLKKSLTKAPVLAHPDWSKPFILDTDWSGVNRAIGGVISQEIDGVERPIAYAAKRLSPTEANYAPYKGELFAAMYMCRHFKYFLFPSKFILRTDHKGLTAIRNQAEPPSGSIARWLEILASYDFKTVYREGPKHGNADSLSRADHVREEIKHSEDHEESVAAVSRKKPVKIRPPDLVRLQKADEDLRHLFPGMETSNENVALSQEGLQFSKLRDSTSIRGGTERYFSISRARPYPFSLGHSTTSSFGRPTGQWVTRPPSPPSSS